MFARRDIEAGEELCFSYNGNYDDDSDEVSRLPVVQARVDRLLIQKGAPSSPPANTDNQKKSDQVYATCRCGASKCTGKFCFLPSQGGANGLSVKAKYFRDPSIVFSISFLSRYSPSGCHFCVLVLHCLMHNLQDN